jgi:putative membrane protein
MAFLDNLALIEVLLALAASLFAYAGVRGWWSMLMNDPKGVRSILRGLAVPAGGLGAVTLLLALWGEMLWPFPSSMAGYNIFFFDPLILLGLVLVAFAATVFLAAKMQYVGLLALVGGAVTMFYGWTGYTAHPAFTKDPFDTLLLYWGFGAAAIWAFPSSVIVDHYLAATDAGKVPFAWLNSFPRSIASLRATQRAAQPSIAGTGSATPAAPSDEYHLPGWVHAIVILFPVFMALAAIAAFWYFDTTLPGHLGLGPAGAP